MARAFRFLLIALASLLVILALAIGVVLLIPDTTYRAWLTEGVSSATGRDLRINGDFSIDVGSSLQVQAADVHFANPTGFSEPDMVSIEGLNAELDLLPLLRGVVEVGLDVESPVVLLATDQSGRGNWQLAPTEVKPSAEVEQPAEEPARGLPVIISPEVRVTNGSFRYSDAVSGGTKQFELESFDVDVPNSRLTLGLEGSYKEQPVSLAGDLGELASIFSGTETELRLDANAGEITLASEGTWSQLFGTEGPSLDLVISVQAPSTASAAPLAGLEIPDLGTVDFQGRVEGSAGAFSAQDLEFAVDGPDTRVNVQGVVGDLVGLEALDLAAEISADALPKIVDMLDIELPGEAPQSLSARAKVDGSIAALAVPELNVEVVDEQVKAALTGSADDVIARTGIRADVRFAAPTLAALSKFAGRTLPESGEVEGVALVESKGEALALSSLDLGFAGEDLSAQVTGSIADLLHLKGVDLNVDASVGSLARFSELAGTDLPETQPLDASIAMVAAEGAEGPAQITGKLASDWLAGGIDGTVEDVLQLQGIDAEFDLELQSLASLSGVAQRDLPDMGPVTASARLASEGEALALSELLVALDSDDLRAQLEGAVADVVSLKGMDLRLSGDTSSLARLSALAGQELPQTPPASLEASVSAQGGITSPVQISATVDANQLVLTAEGALSDLTVSPQAEFRLNLEAPSLANAGSLAGARLPDVQPLKAEATVRGSAQEVSLADLVVALGKSDLTGDAKITLGGDAGKTNVTGLFRSRVVDVAQLTTAQAAAEEPSGEEAAPSGKLFSDDPLPIDALQSVDAYVEYEAEQVMLPNAVTENARLVLSVENGVLELEQRASVQGRPIEAQFELDGSRDPAPVRLDLRADRVALSDVVAADVIQGGVFYVNVEVQSAGNSVSSIMAGLDGFASTALRDSRLSTAATKLVSQDLLTQINPLAADRGYSDLECAALAFDIADGIANTPRGLVARTKEATWLGEAEINLKDETLQASLSSKAREGLGLGAGKLASAIQISGPLTSPGVTPNPEGLAKTGLEAALAISTGGTSLLASGLLDRVQAEQDICEEIFETVVLGKNPSTEAEQPGQEQGGSEP